MRTLIEKLCKEAISIALKKTKERAKRDVAKLKKRNKRDSQASQ